ncbi:MAG: Npt1/Npt2 family nucleotide transporter [Myxococcota bacterium]
MSSSVVELKQNPKQHPIRTIFWPVYGSEHRAFLPLTLIVFLILFNYTILRSIKDACIITASGVEALTFIKFWLTVPALFCFFMFYAKAVNYFKKTTLFYGIVSGFMIFFLLFGWVIYPNRELLQPTLTADLLRSWIGFSWADGIVDIYRYWTLSLFFVAAEMWNSVVLLFLFWQLANSITTVKDAKRFYPHFVFLGHIGLFVAGAVLRFVTSQPAVAGCVDSWQLKLRILLTIVAANCGMILITYWALQRYVFNAKRVSGFANVRQAAAAKPKMSLRKSLYFISRSQYLALIATLVLCYGISMNLVDVLRKHQIKAQYPSAQDYAAFMGILYMALGVATCIVVLIGGSALRRVGWKKAALVAPFAICGGGLVLCLAIMFTDPVAALSVLLGSTPLFLIVVVATGENILSKSVKYALFDTTKEMAYIPLDEESKTKGKAAIDMVGMRLGKSCGSLIQQAMFIFIGPASVIAPYSFSILAVSMVVWIWAVLRLHKRFEALHGGSV